MCSPVRCSDVLDDTRRNGCPIPVHLHFVMVIDHSRLCRSTIGKIAAGRLCVLPNELRVEAFVPLPMTMPVLSCCPS